MFVRVNNTLTLNTDRIIAPEVEQDDDTGEQVFAVRTDAEKFYVPRDEYERLDSKLIIGEWNGKT